MATNPITTSVLGGNTYPATEKPNLNAIVQLALSAVTDVDRSESIKRLFDASVLLSQFTQQE